MCGVTQMLGGWGEAKNRQEIGGCSLALGQKTKREKGAVSTAYIGAPDTAVPKIATNHINSPISAFVTHSLSSFE